MPKDRTGESPSRRPEGDRQDKQPGDKPGQGGPVSLHDREGVYVHSFKCGRCTLEFMVFSWRADRHRTDTVICPECGGRGPFIHFRADVSDSLPFVRRSKREIFRLWPWKGSQLVDDSAR